MFHLKLCLQQNEPTSGVRKFLNKNFSTKNDLTFFFESSNCPFKLTGPAAGKNSGSNTKW
jgi:hypothetical protein